MSDETLVVIPLPVEAGGVTYAIARLVMADDQPFAEAIVAVPGTTFAPPGRISLSRYSLARLRPGATRVMPRPGLDFDLSGATLTGAIGTDLVLSAKIGGSTSSTCLNDRMDG